MDDRRRVSPQQLERLRAEVTERDLNVLRTVLQFRLISGDQLRRLFFPGGDSEARAARRALERLHRIRAVRRLERRIGGIRAGSAGFLYVIGPIGDRLINSGRPRRRLAEPSTAFVAHTLAVAELFVSVTERVRTIDDAEILDVQAEPACWRDFGGIDGHHTLRPDLYLSIGLDELEHRWFIEIDRATEHLPAILRKSTTYDRYYRTGIEQERHGNFPRVLWATITDRRVDAITRTLAASSLTTALFRTVTTDEAIDVLTGVCA